MKVTAIFKVKVEKNDKNSAPSSQRSQCDIFIFEYEKEMKSGFLRYFPIDDM